MVNVIGQQDEVLYIHFQFSNTCRRWSNVGRSHSWRHQQFSEVIICKSRPMKHQNKIFFKVLLHNYGTQILNKHETEVLE